MFTYSMRTRYAETAQDGIIHHSSFVVYLEAAHVEFLRVLGVDISEFEKKRKIYCSVVNLCLQYLRPLHFLEDIQVCVALESFSKIRFRLAYKILRKAIIVATAQTTFCFLNEIGKPIRIPQDILKHFEERKGCLAKACLVSD